MANRKPGMTREQRIARQKYLELIHRKGLHLNVNAAPMRERITSLRRHMFFKDIAQTAGVPYSTVVDHYYNQRPTVHIDTFNKVMSVQVPHDEPITNEDRARGAKRIVRGLFANGFSYLTLADYAPCTYQSLLELSSDSSSWVGMNESTYQAFLDLAVKFDRMAPEDVGVVGVTVNHLKSRARGRGYAPLQAWDLDTIHRADQYADWTGACGTVEGYELHKTYGIRVGSIEGTRRSRVKVLCEPCVKAKAESSAVKPSDINRRAMFLAFDDGMSIRDVAVEFHCSTRTVQRFRAEWNEACDES